MSAHPKTGSGADETNGVALAHAVCAELRRLGWRIATAESCTGGLVAHLLTEVPGVSEFFELGLVTYADGAKRAQLGVSAEVLRQHGPVSRPTVTQMARGVRKLAGAELGLAISGVAGPTGGTPDKPVGTVHLALATPEGVETCLEQLDGTRSEIKRQAAEAALGMVRRYCGKKA